MWAGVVSDVRFDNGGVGINCKRTRFSARCGVRPPGIVRQPHIKDKANCERRASRGERPQPHPNQEPRPLTIVGVPNPLPARLDPDTPLCTQQDKCGKVGPLLGLEKGSDVKTLPSMPPWAVKALREKAPPGGATKPSI